MKPVLYLIFLVLASCGSPDDSSNTKDQKDPWEDPIQLRKELIRVQKGNRQLEKVIRSFRKNLDNQEQLKTQGYLSEELSEDIHIFPPGTYSNREIKEEIGQRECYGLFAEGGEYTLKKTIMNVVQVKDNMRDEGDETTGKKITIGEGKEPILFISGIKDVKEGKLKTAELEKTFLYPGEYLWLKFYGERYSLWAFGSVEPSIGEGGSMDNYTLQISSSMDRNTKQIFTGARRMMQNGFQFTWAGDLDNDGLLDLVMDLSNNDAGAKRTALFLSSKAKEGQLIRKVAEFMEFGC